MSNSAYNKKLTKIILWSLIVIRQILMKIIHVESTGAAGSFNDMFKNLQLYIIKHINTQVD